MSKLLTAAVAIAAVCAASLAHARDGRTTRIEPRPFYGATVTIEAGVRVFRPMPPTKHIIVNPHGSTPLSLGFNETNVYKKSYNYHAHDHEHSGGSSGYRGSGYYAPGRIGVGH
ncbi:MAG: hypothetical protein K0U74_05855 [Alphaproteobacteria bacterium]|nr:hypothetical protein [Alphaproteobacteria bacterium]